MSHHKITKTLLVYLLIAAFEALLSALYLLSLAHDSKNSLFLGYSAVRLITVVGLLLAFGIILALAVMTYRNPDKAERFIKGFFQSEAHVWLVIMLALIALLAGLFIYALKPSLFPELKRYYYLGYMNNQAIGTWIKAEPYLARLQPIVVWMTLVSLQTVLGMIYVYKDELQANIRIDLARPSSRLMIILAVLASVAILWVGLSRALPFLLVYKNIEAGLFAESTEMVQLHVWVWIVAVTINLPIGWASYRWLKSLGSSAYPLSYLLPFLVALLASYTLLTGFVTGKSLTGYKSEWNVFYITADSGSYIQEYNSESPRPPVYPLFIQLITRGTDINLALESLPLKEPIGDITNPLMRVAQAQKFALLAASLAACAALMALMSSPLPVLFFLWLFEYGFFSQEINHIMTEPIAQTWLFLILASFFAFLWKRWKFLLPLGGLFCAALYLTRPAGVYGGVLLAALILWAVLSDWRGYWLPCLTSILLVGLLVTLPIFYSYIITGTLTPSPMYAIARIAFALRVATPEDLNLMPDQDSRKFLIKALELKKVEEANIEAMYPQELEQNFVMIVKNIYSIASVVAMDVLPGGSKTDMDKLLLKVSNPLLNKHRWEYYRVSWNSFWYATTRMSLDRIKSPIGFWVVILICLVLAILLRGWVGFSSVTLIITHLAHLTVVSLFDVPISRYIWATEFLILLALFILIWGIVVRYSH